jgi:hypothetical protein
MTRNDFEDAVYDAIARADGECAIDRDRVTSKIMAEFDRYIDELKPENESAENKSDENDAKAEYKRKIVKLANGAGFRASFRNHSVILFPNASQTGAVSFGFSFAYCLIYAKVSELTAGLAFGEKEKEALATRLDDLFKAINVLIDLEDYDDESAGLTASIKGMESYIKTAPKSEQAGIEYSRDSIAKYSKRLKEIKGETKELERDLEAIKKRIESYGI